MCNRMCIRNAVHADVCTRENVSSFSLRFTRLSIHSMDFDFGFARRFFWLRVFGLSDANAAHRQAFISIEETHILNESTRHAYVTVIVHRVAAAMVAHRNLLNHFLCCLARCLSSLAAVDAATNTLLSLSTAEPISLWWSVCGASSSLWLEKSLRLCDGCRLVACTPFLLSSPSTGSISIPSKNELNAKMPSHLHKYISFKWYRQMNFRIERHPIIRNMEDEQNKMRNAKRVGRRRWRYLYNCCESKYK